MSGKPLANVRHEAFARAYVRLGTGRNAYAAAGYKARMPDDLHDPGPIDAAASRLLKQVRVNQRIERLREAMAKRAEVTEESILDELEQARSLALQTEAPAAAVSATVAKAKLVGLMIERKEIGDAGEFKNMSEDQLRDYIQGNTPIPKPTHDAPDERQ